MDILVCCKVVPDEQDVVVAADGTLSFERAALKIGDYDLNAIEAGAQLAAAYEAKLTCITAGGDLSDDSKMRKSILSRGPEELVIHKNEALAQAKSAFTAQALKAVVEKIENYDLILCGEGSADLYARQVGIQLGELLGIPTVNAVSSIEIDGSVAKIERSLEDQVEVLEIPLPAVLSVVADMNTPRIPSMKEILSAGKKPVTVYTSDDIGFTAPAEAIETLSTLAPKQKDRACVIFEGDDEETIRNFIASLELQ